MEEPGEEKLLPWLEIFLFVFFVLLTVASSFLYFVKEIKDSIKSDDTRNGLLATVIYCIFLIVTTFIVFIKKQNSRTLLFLRIFICF